MRQRLGIGAALIGKPEVLLLDEPATGLDPIGRKSVLDLMESLRSTTTTIFYSTHILDDVQRVSDRVAVIDRGKLLLAERDRRPARELLEEQAPRGADRRHCPRRRSGSRRSRA